MRPNSLRAGPDSLLWVVDTGTPKSDAAPVANGPKLRGFNLTTNQPVKTISPDNYVKSTSFVDDLRFHGDIIYVTDAGVPGLIILNQRTGQGRRVLENDTTTTPPRPLIGEGKKLVRPNGLDATLHADQMEVARRPAPCNALRRSISKTSTSHRPTLPSRSRISSTRPPAAAPPLMRPAVSASPTPTRSACSK